jgi:hypothetical protein
MLFNFFAAFFNQACCSSRARRRRRLFGSGENAGDKKDGGCQRR